MLIPKTNTGLRRDSDHRTRKMGMGARVWSWARDWLGTAWKTPNLPGCRARKRSAGVSHPAPSLEFGDSLKWPESGWVLNTKAGCRAISTCRPKLRRRLIIDLLFTWGGTSPPHTPPAGHETEEGLRRGSRLLNIPLAWALDFLGGLGLPPRLTPGRVTGLGRTPGAGGCRFRATGLGSGACWHPVVGLLHHLGHSVGVACRGFLVRFQRAGASGYQQAVAGGGRGHFVIHGGKQRPF